MDSVSSSEMGSAARYLPEPQSKASKIFKDVVNAVKSVVDDSIGGVSQTIGGDFGELINAQIAAQEEMQTTTMVSNIEKSKHESKMAAIRNIRVS
jgi:hypothetical protein